MLTSQPLRAATLVAGLCLIGCPPRRSAPAPDDAAPAVGAPSTAASAAASVPMNAAPTAPSSAAPPPSAPEQAVGSGAAAAPSPAAAGRLALGKYGCTVSRYDARSGSYEYLPKGSFVLSADGTYTYNGLERPSTGRWSSDPKSGKLSFTGGYLGGGEATPIEGRANQVLPVAPGLDARWKCGHTG